MRYSPKNENIRPLMITILLTVIAIFSILFASYFQNLKWLFQLSFLCFATAALQIFMKYVLTKYEYVCDENSLAIYKIMGKRRLCVGVLEFIYFNTDVKKLSREVEIKEINNEFGTQNILNFTRNLKPEDIYGFSYNYNSKKVFIKLEAEEVFISALNERISNSLKGSCDNDEF